jgi:polysaccharide export outer membrane protein
MNLNFNKTIFIVSVLFMITSCVSNKKITYFQNDKIDQSVVSNVYKTVFKPDDLLQITISSDNAIAVKPFNLAAVAFGATVDAAIGQPKLQSYLIDSKGEIDFPVFGKLKIGGLSREETIGLLKEKLSPDYVKDPMITIRITNFKITVLGDVKSPRTYNIPNERISILDAIGLAGDLNISGRRDNVLVQREVNGEKLQYRVDLLSNNMNTSPVFYLQQNDIVYVEHNYARIQSASSNTNTSLFISVTGLIITIVSLLTR